MNPSALFVTVLMVLSLPMPMPIKAAENEPDDSMYQHLRSSELTNSYTGEPYYCTESYETFKQDLEHYYNGYERGFYHSLTVSEQEALVRIVIIKNEQQHCNKVTVPGLPKRHYQL